MDKRTKLLADAVAAVVIRFDPIKITSLVMEGRISVNDGRVLAQLIEALGAFQCGSDGT